MPVRDDDTPLALAEALESAYRLAQALEGLAGAKVLAAEDPEYGDHAVWAMASELLRVLDNGRASCVRQSARLSKCADLG